MIVINGSHHQKGLLLLQIETQIMTINSTFAKVIADMLQ